MTGELSELELGASQGEAEVARGLAQADTGCDRKEEAVIEVGSSIPIVGAKSLTGKGPPAGSAPEPRDWPGTALGAVGAEANEEATLRSAVLFAGPIGTARGFEHG